VHNFALGDGALTLAKSMALLLNILPHWFKKGWRQLQLTTARQRGYSLQHPFDGHNRENDVDGWQ
jgi:hypothetical protein